MRPLDALGPDSQEPHRAPVPVPPDVLGAALVGAAEGAAAVGAHGVLEHGAPVTDAARPPDLFAAVLAWAWRWDQTSALQLLAVYLEALRLALDDPFETDLSKRFRQTDALWSVASALSLEHLLGDQGADEFTTRAREELPRLAPNLH